MLDEKTIDFFSTDEELTALTADKVQPRKMSTKRQALPIPEAIDEISYSKIIEDQDLQTFDPIPCHKKILGKLVSGISIQLPYELAFQAFPSQEALDVSNRWLDIPKIIATPMVGFLNNKKVFTLLNPSESIKQLNDLAVNPDDKYSVFIVLHRVDIQALKLGLDAYYCALWGDKDDPIPFLQLCLVHPGCKDTHNIDDAKIFRQWCKSNSKPFKLADMITHFGFAPSRSAKFRELKQKAGLTQPRDTTPAHKPSPTLQVRQKRLSRYLASTHFKGAAFMWPRFANQYNKQAESSDKTLPLDWKICCAIHACARKTLSDPSKLLINLCDRAADTKTIAASFMAKHQTPFELTPFEQDTQLHAEILLKSLGDVS